MPLSEQLRLRRMLGDRIPLNGDENSAFFTDEEIDDLIAQYTDLNVAAFYGWLAKMAEFAKLVNRNISGADMRLGDMFKQAELMAKHYGGLAGIENVNLIIGRCVGRAVSLRETSSTVGVVQTGIAAFRLETVNQEARTLMHRSHPETLEDPDYPEPGQVATS